MYLASSEWFFKNLPSLQNDCFDVLHDLPQSCFTLHDHVCDHQALLVGVGEHLLVVYCIYFVPSCWSFWCDTWPTLHGHVRGHQDQLLGVGELLHVVYCIYFASSCWSFWCATWPTSTMLHTSWPCPWPPRPTSWGWTTFTCWTYHLLCLFMLIVLMCHMTYFNPASQFMAMSVATKINFLGLDNFYMMHISSSWCWRSLE